MEIQPGRKGMRASREMAKSIFFMYMRGMRVAQNTVHWHRIKKIRQAQPYPGSRPRIQVWSFFIMRFSSPIEQTVLYHISHRDSRKET